MSEVFVTGRWVYVVDKTIKELRETLDVIESDFTNQGATEVFIQEVDPDDNSVYLAGMREHTAQELAAVGRIAAERNEQVIQQYIAYIERVTGKEVKIV